MKLLGPSCIALEHLGFVGLTIAYSNLPYCRMLQISYPHMQELWMEATRTCISSFWCCEIPASFKGGKEGDDGRRAGNWLTICRLCGLQESLCGQVSPPGGHLQADGVPARRRAWSCRLHSNQDTIREKCILIPNYRPALSQSQPSHHFKEHQLELSICNMLYRFNSILTSAT